MIYNDELRARYAKEKPYRDWIAEETLTVDALDERCDNARRGRRGARRRAYGQAQLPLG